MELGTLCHMPLTRLDAPLGLVCAEAEGLLVMVTVKSPDKPLYEAVCQTQLRAVEKWGTVSVLSVVPRFDGPMKVDKATQEEQGKQLAAVAEKILISAMAVTVPGMPGTMIRLVLTTANMINRARNSKVLATIDEAVEQVRKLPNQRPGIRDNHALRADVQALVDDALKSV